MVVDENGMCSLSEEDSSYHSCNTKKNICTCYHAERNFLGKIGVCWGTKECEACSCGGDETKCDFYEYKRKKVTTNTTNQWIPVTEKLPEKSAHYLAVVNGETAEAYYDNEMWFDPVEEWANWTRFVTHWMSLPEPPKKATPIITNADRIRSMSNTELAKWMEWHDYCPDRFMDAPCIGPDGGPKNEYDCYQCCLDWLNEEVESEEYLWGEKSNIKK